MKKIIFDTNFLIDCFRFKIEFIDEIGNEIEKPFKFFVLEPVVRELEKISRGKTKESKYARLALNFVKNAEILRSSIKDADKAIIKASDKNSLVATNDSKLRKNLKKLGVKTIYLRKKKHLAIG